MVDSVPAELLELQTRFETWRANRKYVRESIPDDLRSPAFEALRSYPPWLVHRVLKLDPSRLRNKPDDGHDSHKIAKILMAYLPRLLAAVTQGSSFVENRRLIEA